MNKEISKIQLTNNITFGPEESGFYIVEQINSAQIILAEQTSLQLFLIAKADPIKTSVEVILKKDSSLELVEIVLGGADQKFSQNWKIIHQGENAKSCFIMKSVMRDKSDLDFSGDVFIPESGKNGDTYLHFQSLLLSQEARAKAIPALEIIANEVKAGHAASIGRIDDELMFYLESRGFDRKQTEQMLLEAFLKEGLKHFSSIDEERMLELERILMEKIDGGKVHSS